MADLLKFKHGLLANMKENSPAIVPGTVYITRDERAMYVDLPAYTNADGTATGESKRIRIGDLQTYEYMSELTSALKADMTNLTKSALFYVEKEVVDGVTYTINALLKWNGTDFIQLNKTADIVADIASIEGRVTEIESKNSAQDTSINGLISSVNTLNGNAETTGSVAHSIAQAVEGVNKTIDELSDVVDTKATIEALNALAKTVNDNATANTTAHNGLSQSIANEASRADTEEKRLAGLISDNATEIAKKANASDVYTKEAADAKIAEEVAKETSARTTAISGVNGEITTIKGDIADLKAIDTNINAELAKKVNIAQPGQTNKVMVTDAEGNVTVGASVADKLTYLSDVTGNIQSAINAVDAKAEQNKTDISTNNTAIAAINQTIETINGTLETHGSDISGLKQTVETLTGSGSTSISKMIEDAVAVEASARQEADNGLDTKIGDNTTAINGLSTELAGVKSDISGNYLKKTDAASTYLTKDDAASTYATQDALNTAKSDLVGTDGDAATANTIKGAHAHATAAANAASAASTAAAAAQSTADAVTGNFNAYVTSNNKAFADEIARATGVEAGLDAAIKAEVERATKAEDDLDKAVTAEETRAKAVESDHEGRIVAMESFWKAADDPEGTIDKLAEIVNYIEADKSGALDMAADINQNAQDIDALEGRMTTAEGQITSIKSTHSADMTTIRGEFADADNTLRVNLEEKLSWGQF